MKTTTESQWRRDAFLIRGRLLSIWLFRIMGWKRSIEVGLSPINSVSRYAEFLWAEKFLDMSPGLRILDSGSPKIFGLILNQRYPGSLFLTDIWEEEVRSWAGVNIRSDSDKGKNLFLTTDARRLCYPDNTFDRVFSISVLEHIEDGGDRIAMSELERVLKPGGLLVVSVPFTSSAKEQWISGDVYGQKKGRNANTFFQRIYDLDSLQSRLIEKSGLVCEDSVALGFRESLLTRFFAFNLSVFRQHLKWINKLVFFLTLPLGFSFAALSRKFRIKSELGSIPPSRFYFDAILRFRKPGESGR